MICFTHLIAALLVLVLFGNVYPERVYAYLDPGTGSFMLQLVLAILLGASCALKLFWNNIKMFFKNFFKSKKHGKEKH